MAVIVIDFFFHHTIHAIQWVDLSSVFKNSDFFFVPVAGEGPKELREMVTPLLRKSLSKQGV